MKPPPRSSPIALAALLVVIAGCAGEPGLAPREIIAPGASSPGPSARPEPEAPPEVELVAPPAAPAAERSAIGRSARLLAGKPDAAGGDAGLRALAKDYAARVGDALARFDGKVAGPMLAWSREALEQRPGGVVFYPFAGPDFLTARRFYPRADRYVLVALQEGGPPPDLEAFSDDDRATLFDTYADVIEDFTRRGFFITKAMGRGFLGPDGSRGITGLLMAFAAREGFEVLDVAPIALRADTAEVEERPPAARGPGAWGSVRLRLRSEADGRAVTLDYVRLDLSDGGLRERPVERDFVRQIARDRVILKAASHLLQNEGFSLTLAALLDGPRELVEDETGIAYDALRARYDVRLFGRFERVNPLFRSGPQRALTLAYARARGTPPLPFRLGYTKAAGSCLQVARRKP